MNMDNYNKLRKPPAEALKQILGGRLKGMTDIKPQWRYEVMTEVYGPCGTGWKFQVEKLWTEPGSEGQVFAFASILLFVKENSEWSGGIPGIGGSMLVEMEKKGLHSSDEGYKMAITDALSTALKMLGVGADIYSGLWDGLKYRETNKQGTDKPEKEFTNDGEQLSKYTNHIDKLGSADEVIAYSTEIWTAATKVLSIQDQKKLKLHCNQIVDIFNSGDTK